MVRDASGLCKCVMPPNSNYCWTTVQLRNMIQSKKSDFVISAVFQSVSAVIKSDTNIEMINTMLKVNQKALSTQSWPSKMQKEPRQAKDKTKNLTSLTQNTHIARPETFPHSRRLPHFQSRASARRCYGVGLGLGGRVPNASDFYATRLARVNTITNHEQITRGRRVSNSCFMAYNRQVAPWRRPPGSNEDRLHPNAISFKIRTVNILESPPIHTIYHVQV